MRYRRCVPGLPRNSRLVSFTLAEREALLESLTVLTGQNRTTAGHHIKSLLMRAYNRGITYGELRRIASGRL